MFRSLHLCLSLFLLAYQTNILNSAVLHNNPQLIIKSWRELFNQETRKQIIAGILCSAPCIFKKAEDVKFMSASSVTLPSESYRVTVVRVYEPDFNSVLYITSHSKHWEERKEEFTVGSFTGPALLKVPFKPFTFGCDGPEDPRIFWNGSGELCIIFNMLTPGGHRKMHVYNLSSLSMQVLHSPEIPNEQVQKNWVPFLIENNIYYIYSADSLSLLECKELCRFVRGQSNTAIGPVRSGSPLIEVLRGVYIGLSFTHSKNHYYRPLISLFKIDNGDVKSLRLIYQSDVLQIPYLHNKTPRIIIPTSIARINIKKDTMDITVFFDDCDCYVCTIKGIKSMLKESLK